MEKTERGKLRGKRVLELGSGAGHLSQELWKLGAEVVATEIKDLGNIDRLQQVCKSLQVHPCFARTSH